LIGEKHLMTESRTDLLPDYEGWLERVSATYESVAYCCFYRLRDRAVADQVSVQVVAGLIGKPKIFKYFGLPYSGRIGRLAERRIAQARQGTLAMGGDWPELFAALVAMPTVNQKVLHLACVLGYDDAELATALECNEEEARIRRKQTVGYLEELSRRILPPEPRQSEEEDDERKWG
jgi:hypothetical protein